MRALIFIPLLMTTSAAYAAPECFQSVDDPSSSVIVQSFKRGEKIILQGKGESREFKMVDDSKVVTDRDTLVPFERTKTGFVMDGKKYVSGCEKSARNAKVADDLENPKIKLSVGTYTNERFPNITRDVTLYLASICDGKTKCETGVSPAALKVDDPDPGNGKRLLVIWHCTNSIETGQIDIPEGGTAVMKCRKNN